MDQLAPWQASALRLAAALLRTEAEKSVAAAQRRAAASLAAQCQAVLMAQAAMQSAAEVAAWPQGEALQVPQLVGRYFPAGGSFPVPEPVQFGNKKAGVFIHQVAAGVGERALFVEEHRFVTGWKPVPHKF